MPSRDFEFANGAADRIDLGNWSVSGSELTFGAWLWFESYSQIDARIFSKMTSSGEQDHVFMLSGTDDGTYPRFRLKTGAADGSGTTTLLNSNASASGRFALGEWILALCRYDGATMKIFLRGVEGATVAKTGSLRQNGWTVRVGNGVGYTAPFDGLIAHAMVWSKALTTAEIADLAAGANPLTVQPTFLEFYSPLGESPEADYSGDGRTVTVNGTAISASDAPVDPPPSAGTDIGVPFSTAVGVDWAPALQEGSPFPVVAVPFAALAGAEYSPSVAVAAAELAVPLSPQAGSDWAPAVQIIEYQIEILPAGETEWELLQDWSDETSYAATTGYPEGTTGLRARARDQADPVDSVSDWTEITVDRVGIDALAIPFSATGGTSHAPSIATAGALAVQFAALEGASYPPALAIAFVGLIVPHASASGQDFSPAVAAAERVGAGYAASAGLEFTPSVVVTTSTAEVPFASEQGSEFAPAIELGVDPGTIAVPFAAAVSSSYAPTLVTAEAIAVPFASASANEPRPTVSTTVVALLVPLSAAAGGSFAPGVQPGTLTVLIPFSSSAGAAFAPWIRVETEGPPLQLLEFRVGLARTFELVSGVARKLEIATRI